MKAPRLPNKILANALGLTFLATAVFAGATLTAAQRSQPPAAIRQSVAPVQVVRFNPGEYTYFIIAKGSPKVTLGALKQKGLRGLMGSISRIYDDGNNRKVLDHEVLQPGLIYSGMFDRETLLDLRTITVSQGEPSAALQRKQRATTAHSFAGSPDDGTKVVILYDASYNTKRYKAWKDGKSGAWDGITDSVAGADNVKNAGVVRRGKTVYVKDEAGMGGSEQVAVHAPSAPGGTRQTVAWNKTYDSTRGAFAITIPADAAIGDYQVQIGGTRGNYATMYVIFDPSYASQALNTEEFKSYAYADEDWQTVVADKDYLNHAFEGPQGTTVFGYRGDTTVESGANGGVFGQRMVEIASHIHGAATTTTLDAAVHAYEVMGQRLYWTSGQGYYGNDGGTINSFDKMLLGSIKAPGGVQTRDELDVVVAEKAALGLGWTDRLPQSYIFAAGQCFNYGTNLTAMLRALGIPSRTPYTKGGAGWPGSFHVWAEAYLDRPAIHPTEQGWWNSSWYKFDANRQYNITGTSQIAHLEGNIGPLVIDGFGDYLLNEYKKCNGISYMGGYSKNAAKCTSAGNGTHAGVMLKPNATASTANLDYDASQSSSPWGIQDLFVPYNGPSSAPTVNYVFSSHHGYALNDTQAGTNGGSGLVVDNTKENDLPALQPGVTQRTIVAGHGFSIYRVPVNGRSTVTIRMMEGDSKARILATFDRMIYSTGKRYELNYDAQSNDMGVLTVDGANKNQIYLWVENKFSHASPGVGQEVTWVSLLDDSAPGGNTAPVANFTASVSGLTVNFTDNSTDSDGTIASRSWDFGDSTTSTETNPSKTYSAAGTYTVKLTVTDDGGATNSKTGSVTVGGGSATELTNGVAKTGISGAKDSKLYYTLAVPAGATGLKFVTSGGTGDADLYVKFNAQPTLTSYDCKSEGSTNAEACNIATAQTGTYHVLLSGYSAYSGLSLTGSYNTGGSTQTYTNTTDYPIRDNTTVESPVTVSGRSGNAPSNTSVAVNIVHTFRGDLKVDLVAPDGSVYLLKNYNSNDSADNVNATYTVNLSTEALNGIWKLRVNDNAINDVGYINSWSVTF